ncbi:hypothetical protein HAX54_042705, partial [Datura stramonium]|nr:hypothetical protein [Datura stramonium]
QTVLTFHIHFHSNRGAASFSPSPLPQRLLTSLLRSDAVSPPPHRHRRNSRSRTQLLSPSASSLSVIYLSLPRPPFVPTSLSSSSPGETTTPENSQATTPQLSLLLISLSLIRSPPTIEPTSVNGKTRNHPIFPLSLLLIFSPTSLQLAVHQTNSSRLLLLRSSLAHVVQTLRATTIFSSRRIHIPFLLLSPLSQVVFSGEGRFSSPAK